MSRYILPFFLRLGVIHLRAAIFHLRARPLPFLMYSSSSFFHSPIYASTLPSARGYTLARCHFSAARAPPSISFLAAQRMLRRLRAEGMEMSQQSFNDALGQWGSNPECADGAHQPYHEWNNRVVCRHGSGEFEHTAKKALSRTRCCASAPRSSRWGTIFRMRGRSAVLFARLGICAPTASRNGSPLLAAKSWPAPRH